MKNEELSDHMDCPRCGGTGTVERPTCPWVGCDKKMMRFPGGELWCPIHG